MQQEWEFNLKNIDLKDLGTPKLKVHIADMLKKEQKVLGIFLSYYTKEEGAVAENVNLDGEIVFHEKYAGNFVLNFDKVHYNACLNIHEQDKSKIKITFIVFPETATCKLKGPLWPERMEEEL